MRIKVDRKSFAQMNNDAFLLGSFELQGNPFLIPISLMNQYLQSDPEALSPEIVGAIRQLMSSFEHLVQVEEKLTDPRQSDKEKAHQILMAEAEEVFQTINRLHDKTYLLLPGGWVTPKGGHAMIYKFHQDTEGNLLFSIYNSGSGLNFHQKKSGKEKDLYNPVLTYKIPKADRTNPDLKRWIFNLLAAQNPVIDKPGHTIDANYLYETLFPQLHHFNGQITLDQSVGEEFYTAGQLSGTCAQRSLHQMLKALFKTTQAYRTFIYSFKAFFLDEYMSDLGSGPEIKKPKIQSQVKKAIRHQLRLLTHLQDDSLKETQLMKLKEYLRQLSEAYSELPPQLPTEDPLPPVTQHRIRFHHQYIPSLPHSNPLAYPIISISPPLAIQGGTSLLQELTGLMSRCHQLETQEQHQALFEQLETFFTRLPLPEDRLHESPDAFYSSINTLETLFKFYENMNALQTMYFKVCYELVGRERILPRMIIAKMSIIAVTMHLNAHCRRWLSSEYHNYEHVLARLMPPMRWGGADAVYLATHIYELDKRYQQIKSLYHALDLSTNDKRERSFSIAYYQKMIDGFPRMKQCLEDRYKQNISAFSRDLRVQVEKNRCTSLCVLITWMNNDDTQLSYPQYDELLLRFKIQESMEKLCVWFIPRMNGDFFNDNTGERQARYEFELPNEDSWTSELKLETRGFRHRQTIAYSEGLKNAKYPMQKGPVLSVFKKGAPYISDRSDNKTQLLPYDVNDATNIGQREIGPQDLESRELFHIRSVSSTQILLTLDYFSEHRDKLTRKEMQVYVEANLFQPGLLVQILSEPQKTIYFFEKFDAFIQKGRLHFHKKGGSNVRSAVFFYRLAYLVNQYAYSYNATLYARRRQIFCQELNHQLLLEEDVPLKSALHHYRFLMLTTQAKALDLPILQEALISLFHMQYAKGADEDLDLDSLFYRQCAHHNFMRILQGSSQSISKPVLLGLMKSLGIELTPDASITGTFPLFQIGSGEKTYILNLEQGLLFLNDATYCRAPLELLTHPLANAWGITEKTPCFTSGTKETFYFDRSPKAPVWFTKQKSKYIVHRHWANAQEPSALYVLQASSQAQSQYWLLEEYAINTAMLPVLQERDKLLWRTGSGQFLVSTPEEEILYRSERDVVVTEQPPNQALLEHTWAAQRLSAFEGDRFILACGEPANYRVQLVRYGLTFQVPSLSEITWEREGKIYCLQAPSEKLGRNITHLIFTHQEEALCLLPIQRFINTNRSSEAHEYYTLQQDITAAIQHHTIAALTAKKESENPQCWQYSGTEHFIAYKMDDKGHPIPSTGAEALYLCYVYLGSHQPEKAWASLDDCDSRLGGLTGTYEELHYIQWIVKALPTILENHDKKAEISTPPYVACQLKALSLLTQCLSYEKSMVFPKAASPANTVNAFYEQHVIKQSKSFYEGLSTEIYVLFTKYQQMRRELIADYHITDEEKESLLTHYHHEVPKPSGTRVAVGALGYEWVQLHLKTLKKEWTSLKAKNRSLLSAYEAKRLKEIETFIDNHEGVSKKCSKLVYRSVDLSLSINVSINTSVLPYKSQLKLSDQSLYSDIPRLSCNLDSQTVSTVLSELTIALSDQEFVENFKYYLAIAVAHNSQNELLTQWKNTIRRFCEATLLASRHVPLTKQVSNIPLFCNILYRILNNPDLSMFNRLIWNTTDLIERVRHLPLRSSLTVPELQDDTTELLSSARVLFDTLPDEIVEDISDRDPLPPLNMPSSWFNPPLQEMQTQWQKLEQAWRFGAGSAPSEDSEACIMTLFQKNLQEEAKVGQVKYEGLKALQSLAQTSLGEYETQDLIRIESDKALTKLQVEQAERERAIMIFFRDNSGSSRLNHRWMIDLTSGERGSLEMSRLLEHQLFTHAAITAHSQQAQLSENAEQQLHRVLTQAMNRLLTLYLHPDKARYREMLGWIDDPRAEDKINRLHHLLTVYVQQGICLQHYERIIERLDAVKKASQDEQSQALFLLGQVLFAENQIDVVKEPVASLFQYFEKILLRPQQEKAIKRLLNKKGEKFHETVEKMNMGEGKSKVLLPILAHQKATGENLVVIEVPVTLLRTNYIDLKSTSLSRFNQRPFLFEFNRDSACSSEDLKGLHDRFVSVMVNKNYVVTTGNALQSLELKYLELLMMQPQESETPSSNQAAMAEWQNQVIWAERLVLLLRHRGDAIIDEAHQGLLLKNKLNYTLGEPTTISKLLLREGIELYAFFSEVHITPPNMNLYEALVERVNFSDPARLTQAMEALLEALLTHAKSPLKAELKHLSPENKALLKGYLSNNTQVCHTIPEFIVNASVETQEKIAFYKEQISNLLPFTLKRHQGEHYGPSKLLSDPAKGMVAIPYSANDKPSEHRRSADVSANRDDNVSQCRFANTMECVNNTIQSCLITGLSKELFSIVVQDWLVQARQELRDNLYATLDLTPTAALFRHFTGGLLSTLNLEDDGAFHALYHRMKCNKELLFSILKSHILPHVKSSTEILHSDAYNHVDLMRSYACLTGTPWNHLTFHQRLTFAKEASLGTDGYIYRGLQAKPLTIRGLDFSDPTSFVEGLLENYTAPQEVRAIIDINASFKGISNLRVAQEIARYIDRNQTKLSAPPKVIKYLLFFNEKNELSALRLQSQMENQRPIVIGSSDPKHIQQCLGCDPSERFTFYDQAHTVGTDVLQAPASKAVVLIDPKETHLNAFYQGIMRMRRLLEGNQSIDIVVPKESQQLSVGRLIEMMAQQEQEQLQKDNFTAAQLKMANLLRNDVLKRLLNIQGEDSVLKKQAFLQSMRGYFVEKQQQTLFQQYGALYETKDTGSLLETYRDAHLARWTFLLKNAGQAPSQEEIKAIKTQLDQIVTSACEEGSCEKQQVSRQETGHAMEVQQEMQVEVEVFAQKEDLTEKYDPLLKEEAYIPICCGNDIGFPALRSLTDICRTTGAKEIPEFSSAIQASKNFYQAYQHQQTYVGLYLKPVHALLFYGMPLQCRLLTQEECAEILCSPDVLHKLSGWISTTQQTVLGGVFPEDMPHNKVYQTILEQVQFFNGEFNALLENRDAEFLWLENDSGQKMEFFKKYLWPCHETLPSEVSLLDKTLSISKKIYKHMLKAPWIDYRAYDWAAFLDTEIEQEVLTVIQSVAEVFYQVTLAWKQLQTQVNRPPLQGESYKKQVPLQAVGYLTLYLEQLNGLTHLLALFKQACDAARQRGASFIEIDTLSPEMKKTLKPLIAWDLAVESFSKLDGNDIYQVLYTLLKLSFVAEHPTLLSALAFDANIDANGILRILSFCKKIPAQDFYGLLVNNSPLITSAHIQTLGEAIIASPVQDIDDNTWKAFALHKLLPESYFERVLNQFQHNPIFPQIFSSMLHRKISLDTLKKMVLKKTPLSSEEITLILNMKIEDAALLGELIIRADTSVNLDALANHALVDQLKDEHYAKIIRNTSKADVITRLIEKPIGDSSYLAIAENRASNADALVAVAKATKEAEVITTVSKHPNINASVYPVIAANQASNADALVEVAKATTDSAVITTVSMHPNINASVYPAIAANQASNADALVAVAKATKEAAVITTVLKHQNINVSVYPAIAANPCTPSSDLMPLVDKIDTPEMVKAVLVHPHADVILIDALWERHLPDSETLAEERLLALSDKLAKFPKDDQRDGLSTKIGKRYLATLSQLAEETTFDQGDQQKIKDYQTELFQTPCKKIYKDLKEKIKKTVEEADDHLPELLKEKDLQAVIKGLEKCLSRVEEKDKETPEIKEIQRIKEELSAFKKPLAANKIHKMHQKCSESVKRIKNHALITKHRGFGRLPRILRSVLGVLCSFLWLLETISGKKMFSAGFKQTFFGKPETHTQKMLGKLDVVLDNKPLK